MCDMHNSREYRWTAPGYTSPLDHFIVTLCMCADTVSMTGSYCMVFTLISEMVCGDNDDTQTVYGSLSLEI